MISHIQANLLLDQYEAFLSPRQQEVLELYFQEDLSLKEIQENLDISKAAVYDALKKGVAMMEDFESKLHLVDKQNQLRQFLKEHPEYTEQLDSLFD